MIVTFEEKYLYDLYHTGRCADKKHRYQPDIVKRYRRCIDLLRDTASVERLRLYNGLNYEVLTGNKQGISSIRVSHQYRLEFNAIEFEVIENENDPDASICHILALSNHYK